MFATAKRDTHINSMNDPNVEFAIPKGKWMFLITSDKQTKYLEFGEIAVWDKTTDGVCYTYADDWEIE